MKLNNKEKIAFFNNAEKELKKAYELLIENGLSSALALFERGITLKSDVFWNSVKEANPKEGS